MTEAARRWPCLLCGSRHEPRIHARCGRLVRCADGRNHELVIVSLICAEAKRQGKQYTKRMLPWFVIPECNIRLDLVVKLLQLVERDPGSGMRLAHEQADAVIGSASELTAFVLCAAAFLIKCGYEIVKRRLTVPKTRHMSLAAGLFFITPPRTHPLYRRLIISTGGAGRGRRGGLTTKRMHSILPSSLSNGSGPPHPAVSVYVLGPTPRTSASGRQPPLTENSC